MIATLGKMKLLAVAAVAATGLVAGTQQASAHDRFSFGINIPLPIFAAPVYTPAPVYAAPAPVYAAPQCQPAPTVVYQQPAPVVVYERAPVYYGPYVTGWDHRGWDHHDFDRRDWRR